MQIYASLENCGIYLSPEVFQQFLKAVGKTGSNTYSIEAIISYLLGIRPDLQYEVALGMYLQIYFCSFNSKKICENLKF